MGNRLKSDFFALLTKERKRIEISGQRIYLRDYLEADRDFYHSWINDPSIMKYLDWKTATRQESDKNFNYVLAQQQFKHRKDFYLGLGLQETQHLIGNAGISIIDDEPFTGEIGWILKPEHEGHGYATEAGRLLINFGFNTLGLKKIFATCDKENLASEKVMLRLGMILTSEILVKTDTPYIKVRYDLA